MYKTWNRIISNKNSFTKRKEITQNKSFFCNVFLFLILETYWMNNLLNLPPPQKKNSTNAHKKCASILKNTRIFVNKVVVQCTSSKKCINISWPNLIQQSQWISYEFKVQNLKGKGGFLTSKYYLLTLLYKIRIIFELVN